MEMLRALLVCLAIIRFPWCSCYCCCPLNKRRNVDSRLQASHPSTWPAYSNRFRLNDRNAVNVCSFLVTISMNLSTRDRSSLQKLAEGTSTADQSSFITASCDWARWNLYLLRARARIVINGEGRVCLSSKRSALQSSASSVFWSSRLHADPSRRKDGKSRADMNDSQRDTHFYSLVGS